MNIPNTGQPISGIWLRTEGNHLVVLAQFDCAMNNGRNGWVEVIRESSHGMEGEISHIVGPVGLESLSRISDCRQEGNHNRHDCG